MTEAALSMDAVLYFYYYLFMTDNSWKSGTISILLRHTGILRDKTINDKLIYLQL